MRKLLVCLFSVSLLCSCQLQPLQQAEKIDPGLSQKLKAAITLNLPAAKPKALKPATKTTAVKIFRADDRCQNLVNETMQIPKVASEKMVAVTLKNVLEQQNISDFKVDSYNVTLNNGIATVDIRVAPSSERRITSLSSCEQFSLFKSIEATLTKNRSLEVYEVKFTQSGKEVYL